MDCLGGFVDRERLSRQLDSLLSNNLTYGQLTELGVVNRPLTHVLRSVCRLTTLTQLRLNNNRLIRLPRQLFHQPQRSEVTQRNDNSITELQDGLFDGLQRLEKLELSYNRISSIGLRVFNGSAMLTSLKYVDLTFNRIQTLEPWPYCIGINGQFKDKTPIDLGHNDISSFTNMMGWKAKCRTTAVHFHLILINNPIKHISDILRGWNISLLTWFCLNPQIGRASSHFSSLFYPVTAVF